MRDRKWVGVGVQEDEGWRRGDEQRGQSARVAQKLLNLIRLRRIAVLERE